MQHDDGRQFFMTWFDRLWRKLDSTVVEDMCQEHVRVWGLDGYRDGRAQFLEFYQALLAAFPAGLDVSVDEALARDDTVMVRCTARGQARNGRPATFTGFVHAKIIDGRMTEVWNCWDFLTMLEHCNALGPGTLTSGFASIAASQPAPATPFVTGPPGP